MAMILGLFPGFMSMIAVYFILKAMGLTEGSLIKLALILCYSGGAGLGFQIAKGFFDTIPVAIDEAALLDGCTRCRCPSSNRSGQSAAGRLPDRPG